MWNRTAAALAAAIVTGAVGTAAPAGAGLIGDTIHLTQNFDTIAVVGVDYGTAAVSPTAGFLVVDPELSLFVDDAKISIIATLLPGGGLSFGISAIPDAFNGFIIHDVTKDAHIIGVAIDPATDVAFFDASRLSFTSDTVIISMGLIGFFGAADTIAIDLTFAPDSPVPEPATLAVFGLVLPGLHILGRRRRS